MAEQTISQRRFTVVQLPVLSIVRETLLLPLNFLPELLKFGGRPFILILAADVFCYGLLREDVSRGVTSILMAIAHFVLFTPFAVAWTKLTIRGPQAVAKHPAFAYSENSVVVSTGDGGDERRHAGLRRHPLHRDALRAAKF